MRYGVEHSASSRSAADPVVLAVELRSGVIGYGETLPRQYVTGEDADSVETAMRDMFRPMLVSLAPQRLTEALEVVEALPTRNPGGRLVTAARAALELALLDAYSRHFCRPIGDAVIPWLGYHDLGNPGCIRQVRCSGVLAAPTVRRTVKLLRAMRCFGIRDFKLKVGTPLDEARLQATVTAMARGLRSGRLSLRLDANGAWSLEQAERHLNAWQHLGIGYIEQPLARGDEQNLQQLRAVTNWPMIHDESIVTLDDAEQLEQDGVADCLNIRISKCGGFIPALKLVHFCRRHEVEYMLGCMVGQTSLLSAVERRFLEYVPDVRFVEGQFGKLLLRDDISSTPLRFHYGGRLRPLPAIGWGIDISPQHLGRLCLGNPTRLHL